jgi:hypothetical protein
MRVEPGFCAGVAAAVATALPAQARLADPGDRMGIDRAIAAQVLPEITARLRSDDAATVAWGAYLAQHHGLAQAGPDLLAAWSRLRGSRAPCAGSARLALLDACIQLDVEVPAETLEGSLVDVEVPVTILLVRAGKDGGALLLERFRELDRAPVSLLWLATGAALLRLRQPGFFAALLERQRLVLRVTLLPREPLTAETTGGTAIGAGVGHFGLAAARTWSLPPWPAYSLTIEPRLDDHLLALGGPAVYWRRSELPVPALVPGLLVREPVTCHEWVRWHWLRAPLGAWDFDTEPTCEVKYSDDAALLRDVTVRGDAIIAGFRSVVARLQKAGLLTAAEAAAAQPNLVLSVADLRGKDAPTLPALPFPVMR